MRALFAIACFLLAVAPLLVSAPPVLAAEPEFPVPNGYFYKQANGQGGEGDEGFAIVDDGQARFWAEFQRLGGVKALGYPNSNRFTMDGFLMQGTQRVVMQKFPEIEQVAFLNVFDMLHDLGMDDWLLEVRQVPRQADWTADTGKTWEEVVARHLTLLEANPAIKAKYYEVPGDPIQMNGLPMAPIADMGNVYVLRAQRIVIQQWKEDTPWAAKGEVTVALGGDIAKETKLLPTRATTPVLPPATSPTRTPTPARPVATPTPRGR